MPFADEPLYVQINAVIATFFLMPLFFPAFPFGFLQKIPYAIQGYTMQYVYDYTLNWVAGQQVYWINWAVIYLTKMVLE